MNHTKSVLVLSWLLCAGVVAFSGVFSGGCGSQANGGSQPNSGTLAAVSATETGGSSASSTVKGNLPAITLHLAGDSTVMTYAATTTQEGWGQELGQFFIDKVTINNQAIGGANVKTFKSGNWNKILSALKAGDYVMMQFGANDSGTTHGPVTPADFAQTLGQMADEVKARQATPIFVTPSAFYQWSGDKQDNARLAPYAEAMVKEGAAKNVLVDDLNARGVEYLNSIGQTNATALYLPSRGTVDKAHFLKAGSTRMAQFVAEELRRINSPLAAYLKQTAGVRQTVRRTVRKTRTPFNDVECASLDPNRKGGSATKRWSPWPADGMIAS